MSARKSLVIALCLSSITSGALASTSTGRTAGQFTVSPVGSAHYTIPLWTPPGIRGLQPTLTLTYDSHLSYGLMGPGWTLSGLSRSLKMRKDTTRPLSTTPSGR